MVGGKCCARFERDRGHLKSLKVAPPRYLSNAAEVEPSERGQRLQAVDAEHRVDPRQIEPLEIDGAVERGRIEDLLATHLQGAKAVDALKGRCAGEAARPVDDEVADLRAPFAAVRAFVVCLLREGDIGDEVFEGVASRWGSGGAVELIAVVGFYTTLAFVMNVDRLPVERDGRPWSLPRP